MGGTSQNRDAKASFSKFLGASQADGSRRMTKLNLKGLLLTLEARTDRLTPPRPEHRHRAPLAVE